MDSLIFLFVQEVTHATSFHCDSEKTFEHEIACINAHPLVANAEKCTLAAVGLWTDISVRLIELPTLTEIHKQLLGGGVLSLL